MNVLIWFKRDLRCQHHPALRLGHQMGRVLPLYIVEPDYWQLPETSARQWEFTAECLTELRDDLKALGATLIVRTGDALTCLEKLCRQHHIARIISHEETGNTWCVARDRSVAEWCQTAGIEWRVVPQPGESELVIEEDTSPPIAGLMAVEGLESGPIPSFKSLKMKHDPCPHRQIGGRSQGLLQLNSFLQVRAETYSVDATSPLTAERACSRVSAHLALGTLAISEVATQTGLRQAEHGSRNWRNSLARFQRQLGLREHFLALPDRQSLVENWANSAQLGAQNVGFLEQRSDPLAAWRAGKTGLPFLDACMRYLTATGWLNFATRSLVLQAATEGLGVDAYQAALHLARSTTDYDPRLHWAQVLTSLDTQTTRPAPALQPVKRGMKHDPNGVFIRRWVPELASVPAEFIHEPWKWPGFYAAIGQRYFAPMVQQPQKTGNTRRAPPVLQRATAPRGFARIPAQHHSQTHRGAQLVMDV
jgi:deoxyribodipyrimidine photo-lyase